MPNYTPGLDDEEDQEQPETFADPTAAPLPPPPTPQDPNVQNASYGLLAGMDPNNIDAKQLLVAQIKQAGMDQKAAQDQAAKDAELKQMEAKQLLYNRLGDRVTNLVGSFTPTPVKMEDNSTNELASRIGSQQQARDKLRQQLLAKSQAGVGGALKGLVDLQGKEMAQKSAQDRFVQGEAGKDRRAQVMAGLKTNPEKKAFENLPVPTQEEVRALAKDVAAKDGVVRQIDAEIGNMEKSISDGDEDQAITAGYNMLKVLNSTEGKDAVGAEEAARLSSFLEYKIANMTKPGSFMGRDIDEFVKQAKLKSNAIKKATQDTRSRIAEASAGKQPQYEMYDPSAPVGPQAPSLPGESSVMAAKAAGPSAQDRAALKWVNDKANASNPKLKDIKAKLKAKGLL